MHSCDDEWGSGAWESTELAGVIAGNFAPIVSSSTALDLAVWCSGGGLHSAFRLSGIEEIDDVAIFPQCPRLVCTCTAESLSTMRVLGRRLSGRRVRHGSSRVLSP